MINKFQYADEIIEAMTRTLWVAAYADFVDNYDGDEEWPRPGAGEDWEDYAPEPPASAVGAGIELAEAYVILNVMYGNPAHDPFCNKRLYVAAAGSEEGRRALVQAFLEAADRFPQGSKYNNSNKRIATLLRSKKLSQHISLLFRIACEAEGAHDAHDVSDAEMRTYFTEQYYNSRRFAREFGSDLAMMALGSGVSWFDDHARFTIESPHSIEAMIYQEEGGELQIDISGLPDRWGAARRAFWERRPVNL